MFKKKQALCSLIMFFIFANGQILCAKEKSLIERINDLEKEVLLLKEQIKRLNEIDYITVTYPSPSKLTGNREVVDGYHKIQGSFQTYNQENNIAFMKKCIASNTFIDNGKLSGIHKPRFITDGKYGNGSSWISKEENSWIKVDLEELSKIGKLQFGRDRLDISRDYRPRQFIIEVATKDNRLEYCKVFDSRDFCSKFSGEGQYTNTKESLRVTFSKPIIARFVKISFLGATGIDELEIFQP